MMAYPDIHGTRAELVEFIRQLRANRDEVIEECAQVAEAEPLAGEPTPEQRERLEAAGVVAVGQSAITATKRNIARRIRARKEQGMTDAAAYIMLRALLKEARPYVADAGSNEDQAALLSDIDAMLKE